MRPIALNLDNSLLLQPRVLQKFDAIEDLTPLGQAYRLYTCRRSVVQSVYRRVYDIRQKYPEPCMMFYGSGDLHHLTLPLVKTMPEALRPEVFVLFDNHPDWFAESPPCHCGNWLARIARIPWIHRIIMIGMDSRVDLRGTRFRAAPWADLGRGRVRIFPYRKRQAFVPLKQFSDPVPWAVPSRWGSQLTFQTVQETGMASLCSNLAQELAGKSVYISIDKDCLRPEDAGTDWEQGRMTLEELCEGIRQFDHFCQVVGIDVCGEYAPEALRDPLKQLECLRMPWNTPTAASAQAKNEINEKTNLKLLDTICGANSPGPHSLPGQGYTGK